ncbi:MULTISPECIES: DNA ligase [unclassified Agarivorans]|uniref:DNA ligase n=1 Tax=unclassified Agarivorans TaxID=2636026 RepID=UPI003D7E027C
MNASFNKTLSLSLLLFNSVEHEVYAAPPPPLVLASEYQQGLQLERYWVCEKYDGVRAYWNGQQLLSRSGRTISIPHELQQQLPAFALDGELWLGRGKFSELVGLIHRQQSKFEQWQKVQFMVFDLPHHPGNYRSRYQQLQGLAKQANFIRIPEYHNYPGRTQLAQELQKISAEGGEGLMLRDPNSFYLATRSHALIKYKAYQDGEAEVVAYSAGKGKYQGMLGALVVQDRQGQRFKIGSGLTDQLRVSPPPLGSLIEYRYNGLSSHGKPRFARFIRLHQTL